MVKAKKKWPKSEIAPNFCPHKAQVKAQSHFILVSSVIPKVHSGNHQTLFLSPQHPQSRISLGSTRCLVQTLLRIREIFLDPFNPDHTGSCRPIRAVELGPKCHFQHSPMACWESKQNATERSAALVLYSLPSETKQRTKTHKGLKIVRLFCFLKTLIFVMTVCIFFTASQSNKYSLQLL